MRTNALPVFSLRLSLLADSLRQIVAAALGERKRGGGRGGGGGKRQ